VFRLHKGQLELVIANAVERALLDRLYITAQGAEPPGNTTPCNPPHSIEVAGQCLASCGSVLGNQCGAQTCAGRPLLDAYDCSVCCHIPAP
jgi:hypothetical protein